MSVKVAQIIKCVIIPIKHVVFVGLSVNSCRSDFGEICGRGKPWECIALGKPGKSNNWKLQRWKTS